MDRTQGKEESTGHVFSLLLVAGPVDQLVALHFLIHTPRSRVSSRSIPFPPDRFGSSVDRENRCVRVVEK